MSSIDAVRRSNGTERIDNYNLLFGSVGKDFFQHISDDISPTELSDNTKLRDYIFRTHSGRSTFGTLETDGTLSRRFFDDVILNYIRQRVEEKRRVGGALRRATVVMPTEPEKPVLSDVVRKYLPVEIANTWDTKLNSTERGLIVGLGAIALAYGAYKAAGAVNDVVGGNTFLPKGENWFTSTLYGAAYLFAGYHIANAGSKFFLDGEGGEVGGIDALYYKALDAASGKDESTKRRIERQRAKLGLAPALGEEATVISQFSISLFGTRGVNQFKNLDDIKPNSPNKEVRDVIDVISKKFKIEPRVAAQRLKTQMEFYRDEYVLKTITQDLGIEITIDEFKTLQGVNFSAKLDTLQKRTTSIHSLFKASNKENWPSVTGGLVPSGIKINIPGIGEVDIPYLERADNVVLSYGDMEIVFPKAAGYNGGFEISDLVTKGTDAIKNAILRNIPLNTQWEFEVEDKNGDEHIVTLKVK